MMEVSLTFTVATSLCAHVGDRLLSGSNFTMLTISSPETLLSLATGSYLASNSAGRITPIETKRMLNAKVRGWPNTKNDRRAEF